MSDLINRQAAIDVLKIAYWDNDIQSAKDDPCIVDAMTDWAIGQVKALPSAQPEIIRCKDCKWYVRADKRRFYRGMDCLNKRIATIVPDMDYCSRAERRNDESN